MNEQERREAEKILRAAFGMDGGDASPSRDSGQLVLALQHQSLISSVGFDLARALLTGLAVGAGAAVALGGLPAFGPGFVAGAAGRWLVGEVEDRVRKIQRDNLALEAERQKMRLESVRVLPADERGRQGIAFDGQIYRNLDTMAVFDQIKVHYFDPLMEQVNAMHKALLALQGVNGPAARQMLEAQAPAAGGLIWPQRVDLASLFKDRQPSIDDLVIGVRPVANGGGLESVSLSLHELMHTLVVGASGWGKSTWLRSLLWQIARAPEPIEVVAVDAYGSEFNILRDWNKLRWPVARNSNDAKAVLAAVSGEIETRKRLFEDNAPLATKLPEYNRATGAGLPPWLVVIDEGTALLNQPGIGEPLRAAVQTARQYGVYILVAGQNAKHSVLDTQTRDNFSSRLCCRTSPTSSRVVLDDKAANELTVKGRMIAQLVGREQVEVQGPFVSRQEFMAALTGGGPREGLPTRSEAQSSEVDDELVLAAYERTGTIVGAARALGSSGSGDHFYRAKEILQRHGRI